MDDTEFDRALIGAAFALAAEHGWQAVSVAEAARRADLPLDRARMRFPIRAAILLRFGRLADAAALALAPKEGPHRDRLFDILMRRFDALQAHRPGIMALLRTLPTDPCLAALLTAANLRSMAWMLEGAGISTRGPLGRLRVKGLLAIWLSTLRAWRDDTSEDLSATMAALDRALGRAERLEDWFTCRRHAAHPVPEPPPAPPPPAPADEPSAPPL
jgi:ubiquinone biosynthesis protein COQ9